MKNTTANNINVKAIIVFLITVLFIVLIAFIFKYNFVSAGVGESVRGFAWGGTESVGGYQGFGWISLNNITDGSAINYGVNVPASDGNLSGFAWSEHYGWISFNGADLAGCAPALAQARITGANVTGGARIIAVRDAGVNAGGFDGCISLSGPSYGVTAVDSGAGYKLLQGYAWSSDLGWIDFDISGSPVPVSLVTPTGFNAIAGACNSGIINVQWNAVAGASSYVLKDNGINLYVGPLLTFSHVVANDGVFHNYTVMASDGVDNSALAIASAVSPISCSAVPAVPTINVSAGACNSDTINVTWVSVPSVTYTIKVDGSDKPSLGAVNNYSHTGLTPGITHNYSVMATNLNGDSSFSAIKSGVAPSACGAPVPTGSITAGTCEIPISGSSCLSNVIWNSSDFVSAASVKQNGILFSSLLTDSESRSVNPSNQTFTLDDTGSGFSDSDSANVTCASGSSWDGSICAPLVVSVAPTIISVTATPELIRSGDTSTIIAEVTSSELSSCDFVGAKSVAVTVNFGIGTESQSVITRELTSSQIVEVQCYPVSDPANKTPVWPVRVNVVPVVQET